MELSLISLALSSPSPSDFVEINEASSSTLPVELSPMPGFQFLENVPLKTPFSRIALVAVATANLESSMMVSPQQSPPALLPFHRLRSILGMNSSGISWKASTKT